MTLLLIVFSFHEKSIFPNIFQNSIFFDLFQSIIYLFSSPDVKVSEEQSDKSGTDPEDSEENFNQADITDYRNFSKFFFSKLIF